MLFLLDFTNISHPESMCDSEKHSFFYLRGDDDDDDNDSNDDAFYLNINNFLLH